MMAVLMGHDYVIPQFLTRDKTVAKRLVIQKNRYDQDIFEILFLSCYKYYYRDTCLEDLLLLGADITKIDRNGDNCLHHLVRFPDKSQLSMLYGDVIDDKKGFDHALQILNYMFKGHMTVLTNAGADNSEQNKCGLIPLQVALKSKPTMFGSILDLGPLVPDEDILNLLVPRPDI